MTADAIDALMARYVAGNLPIPARVLVQSHLQITAGNHRLVRGLEALAGEAMEATVPLHLSARDARLASIFAAERPPVERPAAAPSDGLFPKVLRDFVGFDVADVPWRTKLPGFREYDVGEIDGCHVSLFWIRPGRAVPEHTHEGSELTLVLDGAFNDRVGRYARGDISVADDTIDHRPVAEVDRACIGMAVTDGPLRLIGPMHRRLGDILGL